MKNILTAALFSTALLSAGSLAQAEQADLDWTALSKLKKSEVETTVRAQLRAKGISNICQLSPNIATLTARHGAEQAQLDQAGLLPVADNHYLFAFFDEVGLKTTELIPAYDGPIRSKTQFDAVYVCASNTNARFSATPQGDHVRVMLHP